MASHLASIHGTEQDKVNCPFYFKIGACRHLDRCSRQHHKPTFSATLLVKHIYQHPIRQAELAAAAGRGPVDQEQAREDFFSIYEDFFLEFSKYGRVLELHVVDNIADHLIGHIYVRFQDEEMASDALEAMDGRYYDGRPLQVEFSPVTDFCEARCRDYDESTCSRGGFCNFLHSKGVPPALLQSLEEDAAHLQRKRRDDRRGNDDRDEHKRHRRDDRR